MRNPKKAIASVLAFITVAVIACSIAICTALTLGLLVSGLWNFALPFLPKLDMYQGAALFLLSQLLQASLPKKQTTINNTTIVKETSDYGQA